MSRHAEATAIALRCLGFNVNFAPVLDLSGPGLDNGIGDRALGRDPAKTALLAALIARSHLRAGIIPVGKHFPGLGAARFDSHRALPIIRRSRALMLKRDLMPFRRLRATLPMVMVGHAYYPALQGRKPRPASFSPSIVQGLLRTRLAFRGIVLTDDLEMGAVDQKLHGGEQALAAYAAGHDGLMFCQSEDRILEAHEALLDALERGELAEAQLRARLRRIYRVKERHLLSRRRPRYSVGSMARARFLLESLGPASPDGFDPTARA